MKNAFVSTGFVFLSSCLLYSSCSSLEVDDIGPNNGTELLLANPDRAVVAKNTNLLLDILSNDSLKSSDFNLTLEDCLFGSASLSEEGQMQYRPSLDFVGVDTATYKLQSKKNPSVFSFGKVALEVYQNVSDEAATCPLLAVNDTFNLPYGGTWGSPTELAVLANDLFCGNSIVDVNSLAIVSSPYVGSVWNRSDGKLMYVATCACYYDFFAYSISDYAGNRDTATVILEFY